MPKRYSAEVVESALSVLLASAESNGGEPNLSAVSRETGLSRKALRTWWADRDRTGTPAPVEPLRLVKQPATPPPATVEGDPASPVDVFSLSEVAFLEARVEEATALYEAAKRDRSYVAAGKLFDRQTELYHLLKEARRVAADATGLEETAFLERLEDEAQQMPDQHLEVYVREYLQRHRLQLGPRTGTGG